MTRRPKSRSAFHGTRGNGQASRVSRVSRATGLNAFAGMDRIRFLRGLFMIAAVVIAARLFMVQILSHSLYVALASDQHDLFTQLQPERGEVYAKDRFAHDGLAIIATNRTVYHVYANPKQMAKANDAADAADAVSSVLDVDRDLLLTRFAKTNDVYEPIKHQVTDAEIDALQKALEEKEVDGVAWVEEQGRYYPEAGTTAALTGFIGNVNDERKGQYGLEEYFETELAGQAGSLSAQLDASGRFIAVGDSTVHEAQDGDMLILTIDKNIQYKACSILEEQVAAHQAKQGSIIVMDPKTGAIMALCNAPQYDPNQYSQVDDIQVYINDGISDQYESGSVFKPLVMAAAINEGKVTPYTTYDDLGSIQVGRYNISNFDGKGRGVVDMTRVLVDSLNTGAIFAAQQVGNEKWYEYIEQFGFGKKTGVELSGETAGDISSVGQLKDIYSATSAYGQGLTITPLQLVQAYGALANGGKMMKPYVVDRVVKSNGYVEQTQPSVVSTPVTPETARTVAAMLVSVIDVGHKRAAVDGYYLAGKTGTAQIAKEGEKGYDPFRHKDTFVGFGPLSDPRFVVLIKIDEPRDVAWSEGSTVPIFSEVVRYLVNYLQIPPDRE